MSPVALAEETLRELRRDEEHIAAEQGLLRSPDVCRLAGVTYRQLDYMVRTGRIEDALGAGGSGTTRYFDPEVVAQLVGYYAAVDECPRCSRGRP